MQESSADSNYAVPVDEAVVRGPHPELIGLSVEQAARMMQEWSLTSVDLTRKYLDRIAALDADGPRLGSVLEINPDALEIAASLDEERKQGHVRGPLHGIPVLVKDNFDTSDSMHTTAGSLALMDSRPTHDATCVTRLREAGAVILGKASMSEWANFRGQGSISGWSGRGGETKNPHSLLRNPSGSSSGSAVAVAADLAVVTVGTETDGSVVSPASVCGVVGIKPTVGLVSRAGVIPISHSQDTPGVFGKSVADVALALNAIFGPDPRDEATLASESVSGTDFRAILDASSLRGARLGVPTNFGFRGYSAKTDELFADVLKSLESLGAEIVTATDIPTADALNEKPGEFDRLAHDFRRDLNAYLAERNDPYIRSLADVIAFNNAHADEELRYFGQSILERAEATAADDPQVMQELSDRLFQLSREKGIDAVLIEHNLDALIAPTTGPAAMTDFANGGGGSGAASTLPAIAGYPIITVPAGLVHGLPVGLSFIGTAWSDAKLLDLAYAWEQATQMYRTPTYAAVDFATNPDVPRLDLPSRSLGVQGE